MSGSTGGSRLEKLLKLLDTGSDASTRKAGGQQIRNIATAHPQQLPSIVRKIEPLLQSRTWETRVAAAECLGFLAEHFLHATVSDLKNALTDGDSSTVPPPSVTSSGDTLTLQDFDLQQVLRQSTRLLASGGQGVVIATKACKSDIKQELDELDDDDLLGDVDLELIAPPCKIKQESSELVSNMSALSARERNKLKRQARQLSRQSSSKSVSSGSHRSKKYKKGPEEVEAAEASTSGRDATPAVSVEAEWSDIQGGRWPFHVLCDKLRADLLSTTWEVRHGAAVGLREILTSQAASAGVWAPVAEEPTGWCIPGQASKRVLKGVTADVVRDAVAANNVWLEDVITRVVYVLTLDRFGDFVGDQVVAPVRESAAQVLGAAVYTLPLPSLQQCMDTLYVLCCSTDWEVRHGGLLGLKYLLAARSDAGTVLLDKALPAALVGLKDSDDDVRAVAAEALMPVSGPLAASPAALLSGLRQILWDMLLGVEDLSPAKGSAMNLLQHLYPSTSSLPPLNELAGLIPRLWPMFRHTLTAVRMAVLNCLRALMALHQGMVAQGGPFMGPTLWLLYQNMVLETDDRVLNSSKETWVWLLGALDGKMVQAVVSERDVSEMLSLAATDPLPNHLLRAYRPGASGEVRYDTHQLNGSESSKMDEACARPQVTMDCSVALGNMAATWPAGYPNPIFAGICSYLSSRSAAKLSVAALITAFWARQIINSNAGAMTIPCLTEAGQACLEILTNGLPGALQELEVCTNKLALEVGTLQRRCSTIHVEAYMGQGVNAEGALKLVEALRQLHDGSLSALTSAIADAAKELQHHDTATRTHAMACAAAAVVYCRCLPQKLNVVIKPIMAAFGRVTDVLLRGFVAEALAQLVVDCAQRKPCPNDRILKNLCSTVCASSGAVAAMPSNGNTAEGDNAQELGAELIARIKATSVPSKSAQNTAATAGMLEPPPDTAKKGCEAALVALCQRLGGGLFDMLPLAWEVIAAPLWPLTGDDTDQQLPEPQLLCNSLVVLRVVGPVLHPSLLSHLTTLLPALFVAARHRLAVVRTAAAQCIASLAGTWHQDVMSHLLKHLLPMLTTAAPEVTRVGGIEVLWRVVQDLGLQLVVYSIVLLIPLMARMSDPLEAVRLTAAQCFAALVAMLPLAQGMDPPTNLDEEQLAGWHKDRRFLQQLLDNSRVDSYELPLRINVELRSYQQDGINWLAFLKKFGLHGILADDMGLGKTLQATAIIAASAVEQRALYAETGKADDAPKPTLIICPPTLVGHWEHEITRFVDPAVLRCLGVHGTQSERAQRRSEMKQYDVLIMSYDSLRQDIEWAGGMQWDYCVLDEGHIIKNPKSKVSMACKRVPARHRLLLSGTPLQNNVLELWSLFDFLMPGFLGAEKQFNTLFGKALQVARQSKRGSKDAEAGLLAVERLHKQVMPFILRRTKEQVLTDLPPKIIQDVYCDPSPLQHKLYEDFSKSQASKQIGEALSTSDASTTPHVFSALQYLRKLCSHPLLVLDKTLKEHTSAVHSTLQLPPGSSWDDALRELRALHHAPKLMAFKELLQECGIGVEEDAGDCGSTHRVLVFAQLKTYLDIVERDVLQPLGVSYVRLDGSVEPKDRFRVVQQFNGDPTIEVMLLTTHVGGLGLNLTSADVVIFLEHDWNPMKDLQAMDRAHRLGQTRTVNVYRLLMRGTLEEKVMSLQKFKMDVAAAIVNQDNMSLNSMDTSQLMDLFSLQGDTRVGPAEGSTQGGSTKEGGAKKGLKGMLESIGELWDDAQYKEEFSLDAFTAKLKHG